jgi:hypothetical protein
MEESRHRPVGAAPCCLKSGILVNRIRNLLFSALAAGDDSDAPAQVKQFVVGITFPSDLILWASGPGVLTGFMANRVI